MKKMVSLLSVALAIAMAPVAARADVTSGVGPIAVTDSIATPPPAIRTINCTTTRAIIAAPVRMATLSRAVVDGVSVERSVPVESPPLSRLVPLLLVPFILVGAVKTVSADKDSYPARDSVRQEHNKLVADLVYLLLHRPAWQVAAAAVAPPVCARGGTASKVKTTATTQLFINGVVKSLTGTDDLWTLTGGNLAAGFFRRYLLCWDGATATTVVSVIASTDAATAAACTFPVLPVAGVVIVGILTIQNATNPFIPGTTALNAAGVTDTYIDGIDDSVIRAAQVTP